MGYSGRRQIPLASDAPYLKDLWNRHGSLAPRLELDVFLLCEDLHRKRFRLWVGRIYARPTPRPFLDHLGGQGFFTSYHEDPIEEPDLSETRSRRSSDELHVFHTEQGVVRRRVRLGRYLEMKHPEIG